MIEDTELLRRYADEKSEAAFAELVRRHLDLVYSVALRQVGGDAHLAQDVAQTVFTALARKSAALTGRPVLGGWLYRTTQFAAIDVVRAESRRRARESEAQTMHDFSLNPNPGADVDWEKLRPTLDQAIGELKDDDRDAVVLRFFEGKSFADVGARLRLPENTARMRVERALDKLHAALARRGVTSTSAALGLALASQTSIAAPVGLAASVTGAALASGGAAATSAGTWTIFMSMTKLQVMVAGVIAAVGTTAFIVQARATARLHDEFAGLRQQNQTAAAWEVENKELARVASEAESARAQAAELVRLRDEASALRSRLQAATAARSAKPESARKEAASFTGKFFESDQVDQQSNAVVQIRPTYPAELRKLGISGQAMVDLIVDAKGVVHNVTVVSATHPAIGESALDAVSQWEFEPAQKGGQAVAVHLQIPIGFTISNGESTAKRPANTSGDAKPRMTTLAPWF